MVLLKLNHMRPGMLALEIKGSEERLISSREKAEDWIKENGFFIGRRTFLKGGPLDWRHEGEAPLDHVFVEFKDYDVDGMTEPRYKGFHAKAPWD